MRLDTVAKFRDNLGAAVIGRFDLQYAAMFYANPAFSLGNATDMVFQQAAEFMPVGYTVKMTGQAEELAKTMTNTLFILRSH